MINTRTVKDDAILFMKDRVMLEVDEVSFTDSFGTKHAFSNNPNCKLYLNVERDTTSTNRFLTIICVLCNKDIEMYSCVNPDNLLIK